MLITRINSIVPPVKSENLIECIAGEDIPAGTIVAKDSDDLVYCADIYDESYAHRTIGIATQSVYIDENIDVQVVSSIKFPHWNWEFSKPVYCGDYGLPTQIKGTTGFVQMVGIPYQSDMLYIDIEPAIIFDMYKPNIRITQDQYIVSTNQEVTFNCANTGYSQIEWGISGKNHQANVNSLVGTNLSTIKVKWNTIGRGSVKVRIKDSTTGIWSLWSDPLYVTMS